MLIHLKPLALADIDDFVTGFCEVLSAVLDDDLAFQLSVVGLRLQHHVEEGVVTFAWF